MHSFLLGKAHLVLGGMNIDVHLVVGDLDKKNRHWKLPLHQAFTVSLKQGVPDNPVADKPAVDKYICPSGGAARNPRRGCPAGDGNGAFIEFYSVKIVFDRLS